MLSRFRIGLRLGIAFSIMSVLLAVCVGAGFYGLNSVKRTADLALQRDAALAQNALNIKRLALEERRYEKDTFINIENLDEVHSYHDKWENTKQGLADAFAKGMQLTDAEELRGYYREATEALEAYAVGYRAIYQRIISGELTSAGQANTAFSQYKDQVYQLESLAEKINETAARRMEDASHVIANQYHLAASVLLGVAIIALILAIALAYTITRSITVPLRHALDVTQRVAEGDLRQNITVKSKDETGQLLKAMAEMSRSLATLVVSLRHSSNTVHSSAHEVKSGSQELSTRTEQQAAALQETAASMEEMTATASQNTATTVKASELAVAASQSAQSSGKDVQQNIALMHQIAASSKTVNGIIEAIDAIAFQTNILALNASVEAARAGEKGKGFAVVAGEVRALASRSATSASEIRSLLEDMREKIEAGSRQAERSGKTIGETEAAIHQLAAMMKEISAATREQISGIEQVNLAVSQMDSVTQQNAAMVEESTAAAVLLGNQADEMKSLISVFQINEARDVHDVAQADFGDKGHFVLSQSKALIGA
ncbi:methyl-accepting chemotaxis protein [Phytohalomonas tamaricis]|uniref:methyl-accepting chemotaxis protein n=1 Tax=Phytohalomonas tamaricis TaxID=2081032 RepID=UPI000D0B1ED1|nr:methyl-accepting chemotaxis protein [Phytohalomonas tamaricis]